MTNFLYELVLANFWLGLGSKTGLRFDLTCLHGSTTSQKLNPMGFFFNLLVQLKRLSRV